MNSEIDSQFTEFLREKANEAKIAIGYHPKKFLGMLNAEGGFKTVTRLLSAKQISEGFTTLFMGGRLDLSVEALIVESEWRPHIDSQLIARAEKMLRDANYSYKPYETKVTINANLNQATAQETLNPPTGLSDSIATESTGALTFSALCERLGTPLKNKLDRWCGISDTDRRAVFTVWADRLINGRYVYWNDVESPKDTRIGARELHKTIQQAITGGYDTYGILCEAEDLKANPRKRRLSMDHKVLVLRFAVEPPGLVAYISGEVAVDDIISNSISIIDPFPSAIDDIGLAPPGTAHPNRVAIATTGYRRDDAVRKHVLERAQGHCMHCGAPGFELPDGTRYLEAHHVIALANDGPDTVDNVIALCAHHHREAHYGRNAEALEAAFLTKLKQLAN